MCPQFDVYKGLHLGDEDCLHLSVYVPKNADTGFNDGKAFPPTSKLPVMFWIFGGAFVLGDEQEFGFYNGEALASSRDVIIVAANYRVGAFGFLAIDALEEEDKALGSGQGTYGNYGIQDQSMALKWVKDNISAFGGDPEDVTIFGQSAGGMSVCTHYARKEQSAGLFKAAIMESGTCDSPEFFLSGEDAKSFGDLYTTLIGCDRKAVGTAAEQLACLRGLRTGEVMYGMLKAWETFRHPFLAAGGNGNETRTATATAAILDKPEYMLSMAATMNYMPPLAPLMPFGPVIDGTSLGLPKMPLDSIKAGEAMQVPFLLGSTLNEGSLFVPAIPAFLPGLSLPLTEDMVALLLHKILDPRIGVEAVNAAIPELLYKYYPVENYKSYDDQVSHILRDYVFLCSSRRAARASAKQGNPTYLYQFSYLNDWVDFKVGGDYHTAEIYFVFGNDWPPVVHRFSSTDDQMVDAMGRYWTTFASTGNPNYAGGVSWPTYEEDSDRHISLNVPSVEGQYLNQETCDYHDALLGFTN